MGREKIRKYVIIIAAVISLVVLAALGGQCYLENKIETFLSERLPNEYELVYEDLDVNLLLRKVQLTQIDGLYKATSDTKENTKINAEKLILKGIAISKLLSSDEIIIDEILIKNINLIHAKTLDKEPSDKQVTKTAQRFRRIKVGKFNIENGGVQIVQLDTNYKEFSIQDLGLELRDLDAELNAEGKLNAIYYRKLSLSGNAIAIDLGAYEKLKIGSLDLTENKLAARAIHLVSKHSKQELSKVLTKQRDHIDLAVPEILFSELIFDYEENGFGIKRGKVVIDRPELHLFRDKLLPEDLSNKLWYGRLLENLPFQLRLPQVVVKEGYVSYAELVDASKEAGEIAFSGLDATLKNISTGNQGQIDIEATANINAEAPIKLNLKFDKSEKSSAFTASGVLKNFDSKSVNSYLESNLNARAEGTIRELYFTISGNAKSSSGEMKMNYENFSFAIMKEKGTGINKLLTSIGNLFTKSNSKNDGQEYRYGVAEAKRDPSKSFINYLWSNVKNGIIDTMTGNGEKEQ